MNNESHMADSTASVTLHQPQVITNQPQESVPVDVEILKYRYAHLLEKKGTLIDRLSTIDEEMTQLEMEIEQLEALE